MSKEPKGGKIDIIAYAVIGFGKIDLEEEASLIMHDGILEYVIYVSCNFPCVSSGGVSHLPRPNNYV